MDIGKMDLLCPRIPNPNSILYVVPIKNKKTKKWASFHFHLVSRFCHFTLPSLF